jgi:diguanylate cyclase (GGDEF)-like protein
MQTDHAATNEALIQFLYRAPIGLVQIALDGAIEMLNPMSSSLLMPLAVDGNMVNLFDVLDQVAPELRRMTALYAAPAGVICESFRIDLGVADDAHPRPRYLSVSLLKLDAGKLMAVLADATAEAQRETDTITRRLNSAARIDALTQMPNRRAVQEQIGLMLQRSDGSVPGGRFDYAVLFLNFDRFKQINDSFGNATGDQVLVAMAARLRAILRPPGDGVRTPLQSGQMAARIGGDEFVVILDGMRRASDVESVARRLLQNISKPQLVNGHEIICNVSIGIVMGSEAAGDADSVLRDASIAMAMAKSASCGFVLFEQAMRERAARRGDIEGDLRRALHERQLFVVYQPVVGLQAGGAIDRSSGVEALVRWQHPLRGVVPPLEFIEVAEECGLIGALGDFVLEQACSDFAKWRTALGDAAPRKLAVNLSRAQLGQADFAAHVAAILAATGMQASQLQLEVTESLAAQDDQVQRVLHELKALGLKLALDDFGTGYSSLASLHLLPVDTVKIDRSFVSQSDTSAHHRVLIEATVKVARSLGMDTVAEGIETAAQATVVEQLACDKGQGYFYSRPLTSTALVEWIGGAGSAQARAA